MWKTINGVGDIIEFILCFGTVSILWNPGIGLLVAVAEQIIVHYVFTNSNDFDNNSQMMS